MNTIIRTPRIARLGEALIMDMEGTQHIVAGGAGHVLPPKGAVVIIGDRATGSIVFVNAETFDRLVLMSECKL